MLLISLLRLQWPEKNAFQNSEDECCGWQLNSRGQCNYLEKGSSLSVQDLSVSFGAESGSDMKYPSR